MTVKRFTYLNTHGWTKDAFLNTMNGLNEKNEKLKKENEQLKQQIEELEYNLRTIYFEAYDRTVNDDKEVEWLRNNTVWEQMPSNKKTFTTTNVKEDYK